jgi:hypothetical protein
VGLQVTLAAGCGEDSFGAEAFPVDVLASPGNAGADC